MLTVFVILAVTAFVCTILSMVNPPRVPLWVAVILLCLIELLRALPIGKT